MSKYDNRVKVFDDMGYRIFKQEPENIGVVTNSKITEDMERALNPKIKTANTLKLRSQDMKDNIKSTIDKIKKIESINFGGNDMHNDFMKLPQNFTLSLLIVILIIIMVTILFHKIYYNKVNIIISK